MDTDGEYVDDPLEGRGWVEALLSGVKRAMMERAGFTGPAREAREK